VYAYNANNTLGFFDKVYQCPMSQKLLTTHILSSTSKRYRYLVSVAIVHLKCVPRAVISINYHFDFICGNKIGISKNTIEMLKFLIDNNK